MKKINTLIIIAAMVAVLSIIMMIIAIIKSGNKDESSSNSSDYIIAEFVPPEFEQDAISGVPKVDDDMGYSEIDAQSFKFSICGKPIINSNKLTIFLTNPKNSTVWLKVRVYNDNDDLLGETGIIKPDEYVEQVELTGNIDGEIKYKIMAYEPETYYSEGSVVLNTTVSSE